MIAIVFDLDGTLVDSAPDMQSAVNQVLAEEARSPLSLATITSFMGHGLSHLVHLVIKANGFDHEQHAEYLRRVTIAYKETNGKLTRAYPGAQDSLAALVALGHPLGVCTNKPAEIADAVLKEVGMSNFFETIIGGDTLPVRKPDPAPLRTAFASMKANAGLFVGDTEIDADTARRAAVPFLLHTRGYRKTVVNEIVHHKSFDNFVDLPFLVNRF